MILPGAAIGRGACYVQAKVGSDTFRPRCQLAGVARRRADAQLARQTLLLLACAARTADRKRKCSRQRAHRGRSELALTSGQPPREPSLAASRASRRSRISKPTNSWNAPPWIM